MSRRFTIDDLIKKGYKIDVQDDTLKKKDVVVKEQRPDAPQVKELGLAILAWCAKYDHEYQKEFKFCPSRKFRMDFCITDLKIGIEYEGIFSRKSRHTSLKGYMGDIEKYNLATKMGYKILRYHASNYKDCLSDLNEIAGITG